MRRLSVERKGRYMSFVQCEHLCDSFMSTNNPTNKHMYSFCSNFHTALPLCFRKMAANNPKSGTEPVPPPPPSRDGTRRNAQGVLTGPAAKAKADPAAAKAPDPAQPKGKAPAFHAAPTNNPPAAAGGVGDADHLPAAAPRGNQTNVRMAGRFAARIASRLSARTRRSTNVDARVVTPPHGSVDECPHHPTHEEN